MHVLLFFSISAVLAVELVYRMYTHMLLRLVLLNLLDLNHNLTKTQLTLLGLAGFS